MPMRKLLLFAALLLLCAPLNAQLTVVGDTTLVVTKLPFDVVAPAGGTFYNWRVPAGWKTTEAGNKLTVQEAADGSVRVAVKVDTIDFDKKAATSTVQVLDMEVRAGKKPAPPDPAPPTVGPIEVLLLYETGGKAYPPAFESILNGYRVRDYLKAKCGPDPQTGPGHDGKAYRIWDQNAAPPPGLWKTLLDRPRTGLPWLVVSRNGAVLYEAALPTTTTVDQFLNILKTYGG